MIDNPLKARDFITLEQARHQYGITPSSLNLAIANTTIESKIVGGKTMVSRDGVRDFCKRRKAPVKVPDYVDPEKERRALSTRQRLDEIMYEKGLRPSGGIY